MMKVAMSAIFLAACLLAQASAQQNWWEMSPDGTVAIANSRVTTAATPTSQAPAVSTQCPCLATPEYNPVCGDNRQTYTNPKMLECAQQCGQNVRLLFHGRCEKLS